MKIITTLILLAAACSAQSPIACNLQALTPAEREHFAALGRKLRAAAAEVKELPNGLSFRISSSLRLTELADWVEAERKCCPFLDFTVKLECEGGPVELALTGREGVKQFLLEEFGKKSASAPGGEL